MSGSSYEDEEIGVICPACDYEIRKSIGWIRTHTQIECSGCGQMIDIESRNFRMPGRTRSNDDPSRWCDVHERGFPRSATSGAAGTSA